MSEMRLVLGRAGTGKTRHIYRQVTALAEQDPLGLPVWVIVPEQATHQAELDLSSLSRQGGLLRVRVSSFQRLAQEVRQQVQGAARPLLSDVGRQMLLRRILSERGTELRQLGRGGRQPGFCSELASLLGEIKSYGVEPEHLARLADPAGKVSDALADKLHDLAFMSKALRDHCAGLDMDDGNDLLHHLAVHIHEFGAIRGGEVFLDGFSGFSPAEYAVIKSLLRVAGQVTVCLTLPPEDLRSVLSQEDPFYTPWRTAQQLLLVAEKAGKLHRVIPLRGGAGFARADMLTHLEKSYHDYHAEAFTSGPGDGGLYLISAAGVRAETEAVAREIISLCRDRGYRYRDICVIMRDMSVYDHILAPIFTDHGIPSFLDRKRSALNHPLFELLRSLLEAVQSNLAPEPLVRCLKTDLWPLSRSTVDLFENYLLATGVRGEMLLTHSPWPMPESDEERLIVEQTRRMVAGLMGPVYEAASKEPVAASTRALMDILSTLRVEEILAGWSEAARAGGDPEMAQIHAMVLPAVSNLLEELSASMGEERVEALALLQIVSSGLEGIDLGVTPAGMDQVFVGSIDRSRFPVARAAFVMGANEGVFPARAMPEGILSDEDRLVLAEQGLDIGPTTRQRLFEEEHFVYLALTRAQERLYLSYSTLNSGGGDMQSSAIVRRVRKLFPSAPFTEIPDNIPDGFPDALSYIAAVRPAASYLARKRRGLTYNQGWRAVAAALAEGDSSAILGHLVERALTDANIEEPLPDALVRGLYGMPMRGSVSRLERFNSCPFAYFAAYGLRLKERKVYRLRAPDIGNFLHQALDMFALRLHERNLDWGSIDGASSRALAAQIVEELAPSLSGDVLLSSERNRYVLGRLERALSRSAAVMGEQMSRGRFRPALTELSFTADDSDTLLKVDLPDGSRMELSGRIDRVDTASRGGKNLCESN